MTMTKSNEGKLKVSEKNINNNIGTRKILIHKYRVRGNLVLDLYTEQKKNTK